MAYEMPRHGEHRERQELHSDGQPPDYARHTGMLLIAPALQVGIETRGAQNACFRLGATSARRHCHRPRRSRQHHKAVQTRRRGDIGRLLGDNIPRRDAKQEPDDGTFQRRSFHHGQRVRHGDIAGCYRLPLPQTRPLRQEDSHTLQNNAHRPAAHRHRDDTRKERRGDTRYDQRDNVCGIG